MYDYETMQELERIEKEINALQDKMKILRQRSSLAILCEDAPIAAIRYSREHDALYFSKSRYEAWQFLRDSASCLFLPDKTLHTIAGYGGKTVTPVCTKRKKIANMTAEEQQLAGEYLKETVSVYNKYFMLANDEVIWNGEPYKVTITD